MSNQLKLLIYILMVVAIFYFVQDRFHIFDIKFDNGEVNNSIDIDEGNQELDINKIEDDYLEIYNSNGDIVRVNIEVAQDIQERSLGLSNRKYLGDYDGMLFIFDVMGSYPFWMKDMLIDLDMIFIDDKGFIVDIREDLKPCNADFCPNVISNQPFKYVLEVNNGFCKLNSIVIGNSLILNLKEI